jgi:hypothetical protein
VAQAKAQVIVSTATPFALTSVSISPCGKRTPDAMAAKEIIEPGRTRAFAVQPGCHDYHTWGYELGRLLGEVSVTGGTVNVASGAKETVAITSALKKSPLGTAPGWGRAAGSGEAALDPAGYPVYTPPVASRATESKPRNAVSGPIRFRGPLPALGEAI